METNLSSRRLSENRCRFVFVSLVGIVGFVFIVSCQILERYQFWIIALMSPTKPRSNITKQVLCIRAPGGRLGNFMFVHAATLGIAHAQNLTPAIVMPGNPLPAAFRIGIRRIKNDGGNDWHRFTEKQPHVYDDRVRTLSAGRDQSLRGFFQSWKYFPDPDVQEAIRQEFRFRDSVLRQAKAFIANATEWYFDRMIRMERSARQWTNANHSLKIVGIHIRRGDLAKSTSIKQGYTMAPASYLKKAMDYLERKYKKKKKNNNNNDIRLLYVVCSDSIDWAKENLRSQPSDIVFSENNKAPVDLAILSFCDDVIMTVGSFGWWAGWLAGGTTVYWNGYPEPGSTIGLKFRAEDYYHPDWVGLAA